jgi:hypothetical protein
MRIVIAVCARQAHIEHSQVRFAPKAPELTKLDALLGMLAASVSTMCASNARSHGGA